MSCDYPETLGPEACHTCGGIGWAALVSIWVGLADGRSNYNQLCEVLSELEVAVSSFDSCV